MRCDPDYCDIHDFAVAPNSAWCRMEYHKRGSEGSRLRRSTEWVTWSRISWMRGRPGSNHAAKLPPTRPKKKKK